MKAAKFVSLICAVTMIMNADALNFSASAESSTALSAGSGMVPEELYEADGRDDTVNEGMVPEELYEADGRDDNVNPGTGFKGFAAAIAVTGACGAAAVAAYKFGKKK